MSSDTVIKVENLSKCYQIYDKPRDRLLQMLSQGRKKYYREFWALDKVSFEVSRGETVGIIGKNGSGKSTLLQLICGTLNPTSGSIKTNGKIAALLELGAGFNPEFTGKENVFLSASLYGLAQNEIQAKLPSITKFADIGEHFDQPVKTYSSGMYVRLAFSVIAHVDADVLVVDEALAVGDLFFQQKCMRFLHEFKARGGSLIFVSHDTAAVSALCERAILLSRTKERYYCIQDSVEAIIKLYLSQHYSGDMENDSVFKSDQATKSGAGIAAEVNSVYASGENVSHKYAGDMAVCAKYFVSSFNVSREQFGNKRGTILHAEFRNANNKKIEEFDGGTLVKLVVLVSANADVPLPSVAFLIKDKQGQFISVESTDTHFDFDKVAIPKGNKVEVEFTFTMPNLIRGVYMIDFAFTDGTVNDHVSLHWVHDAIKLDSVAGYHVMGIVGAPNLQINWNQLKS